MSINSNYWCPRVKACFELFVKQPSAIHHLLLYGPPGSGKTTAAHWLVDQIWGHYRPLMCMSMNAADERSLDSIRQKALPFFRMDWRTDAIIDKKAPRFLILDECETLTEPAQMSLTNILDSDPKDFCLVIICNSQSKIHPKLRQRLLKIRFDPPNFKSNIRDQIEGQNIYEELTRGDLRISKNSSGRENEIKDRLWKVINPARESVNNTADFYQKLTEIFFLYHSLDLIDEASSELFNHTYVIMEKSTSDIILENLFQNLIENLRRKIENIFDSVLIPEK